MGRRWEVVGRVGEDIISGSARREVVKVGLIKEQKVGGRWGKWTTERRRRTARSRPPVENPPAARESCHHGLAPATRGGAAETRAAARSVLNSTPRASSESDATPAGESAEPPSDEGSEALAAV